MPFEIDTGPKFTAHKHDGRIKWTMERADRLQRKVSDAQWLCDGLRDLEDLWASYAEELEALQEQFPEIYEELADEFRGLGLQV